MGHTVNSIFIEAPYDLVFDVSNDIEQWPQFFKNDYPYAKIVERVDNKIVFQLTNAENKTWTSWRLLFKDQKFAYAERLDPLFPFLYMKLIWLYTPKNNGIEMTWIQHFQMDPTAPRNDEQAEVFVNNHSRENLKNFKEIIEGLYKNSLENKEAV